MTRIHTPEYRAWINAKQRCHNHRAQSYKNYGARGLSMCPRWIKSFDAFLSDMGPRPSPDHELERKNNNLGYDPENCVWATRIQQARNRRTNVLLTHAGETLCAAAWAERLGGHESLIRRRLRMKWSVERAVTEPIHVRHRRRSGNRSGNPQQLQPA